MHQRMDIVLQMKYNNDNERTCRTGACFRSETAVCLYGAGGLS